MLTQLVMDAEVTAQIGATHGERVPERRRQARLTAHYARMAYQSARKRAA